MKTIKVILGLHGICCNLIDHIRLPIIHTKTYINIKQRQETRTNRIKQIILLQRVHTIQRTELSSHLAQQPNIYDYRVVTK